MTGRSGCARTVGSATDGGIASAPHALLELSTSHPGTPDPPRSGEGRRGRKAAEGGLVGGTIDGETWESQDVGFLISPVVAVDQNAQGGYIVGGTTSNTETFEAGGSSGTTIVTKNQVIIYVAPDGTRTELVRVGDTVTVDVGGTPDERRIVTLNQSDAQFAAYLDDTHLYFVAGTDDFAGTIPNDLFARIALPGGCRADLDGDGELTLFDFLAFQNLFDSGDLAADFDGDGSLTLFDFLAFQNEFDAGCP